MSDPAIDHAKRQETCPFIGGQAASATPGRDLDRSKARRRHLRLPARRLGQLSVGLIIAMAGLGDIFFAAALWYFISDGEMIMNIFFGLIALSGLGMIGFGMIKMVQDA